MKELSTSDVGSQFEKEILKRLGPAFSLTSGSGCKWRDGDLRHQAVVVECKVKNSTEGFSAPLRELNKLHSTAELQGKDWLYIQKNSSGKVMVLLDLEAFIEMTEEWRKKYER